MNEQETRKQIMERNNFIIGYFHKYTFQQLYLMDKDIEYYINVYKHLKKILTEHFINEKFDISDRYLFMNERNRLNDGIKIPFKNSSEYIKEIHEKRTIEKKEVLSLFDKLFLI